MANIRPIENENDHRAAINRIGQLIGSAPGTPASDELTILASLARSFEQSRRRPTRLLPVDVIKAHMDMAGHSLADLANILGSRSRATEILSRKRRLTMAMVWNLHMAWKIPADLLITPYALIGEGKRAPRRKAA